jgi:hypothetical protein
MAKLDVGVLGPDRVVVVVERAGHQPPRRSPETPAGRSTAMPRSVSAPLASRPGRGERRRDGWGRREPRHRTRQRHEPPCCGPSPPSCSVSGCSGWSWTSSARSSTSCSSSDSSSSRSSSSRTSGAGPVRRLSLGPACHAAGHPPHEQGETPASSSPMTDPAIVWWPRRCRGTNGSAWPARARR